jgi:hypothetical protein
VPNIVTGISQDGDTSALARALKTAGLALDPLQVIAPDDAPPLTATSLREPDNLTGVGLETGTGVPGLTNVEPGISAGDSLWDMLADLNIPDDELENYVDALEAGRTIVAYHATSRNVAAVEGLFRANGMATVKTF